MDYLLHLLIVMALYSVLAISLDLVVGRAGLMSVAHAAFYGIGAYVSVLMLVRLGCSFPCAVLASMGGSALASLIVSLMAVRLHSDYFAIATLGFQLVTFNVLNAWTSVTRGPLGIPGIPRPIILRWKIDNNAEFLVLALAGVAVAYSSCLALTRSPFGRVLHAIREDEVFAEACGKRTWVFKTVAFAVSSSLAGMAGALYASYMSYVDPTSFTVADSILVLSMVIIGGAGSMWGPAIGAIVLVSLPEALRFLGLPTTTGANVRQIVYGALLVAAVMVRPQGLVGRYALGR